MEQANNPQEQRLIFPTLPENPSQDDIEEYVFRVADFEAKKRERQALYREFETLAENQHTSSISPLPPLGGALGVILVDILNDIVVNKAPALGELFTSGVEGMFAGLIIDILANRYIESMHLRNQHNILDRITLLQTNRPFLSKLHIGEIYSIDDSLYTYMGARIIDPGNAQYVQLLLIDEDGEENIVSIAFYERLKKVE